MAKRHSTDQAWPMDELQRAFVASWGQDELRTLPPKKLEKMLKKVTDEVAKEIGKDLAKRAPKMLAQRRKDDDAFHARNFRRWREAFDLIETIWVCCEEMGRNFNQHFRPTAVRTEDFVFEAMTSIHAKSLLVTAEIICLMKGGFPDAALTRWRTLYELNVVATLISKQGPDLALRYLAHADVQAARDIDPSDLEDDEKLREQVRRSEYAIQQFGDELRKHYGWACKITDKQQPNFEHIEKLAEKTEGRALYKHASQHIHSNHRLYDQLLGTSESDSPLILVGQSNSGMVGPLTLTAMSMVETTALYLVTKPNFDRGVYSIVLMNMAQRLHKIGPKLEKRTLMAARKQRAAKRKRSD